MNLAERKAEILAFIESQEPSPTAREIAAHFEIGVGAVADHIRALRTKVYIAAGTQKARGFATANSYHKHRAHLVHVPLYGSIPAGFADERHQEADGCVSIDATTLGVPSSPRLFALRVKGDSMTGKHLLSGDIAILEHGREAHTGDIVAALIDGENTLKVYQHNRGRPFLRTANPHYPDLVPSRELVVQGVLVGVFRRVPK